MWYLWACQCPCVTMTRDAEFVDEKWMRVCDREQWNINWWYRLFRAWICISNSQWTKLHNERWRMNRIWERIQVSKSGPQILKRVTTEKRWQTDNASDRDRYTSKCGGETVLTRCPYVRQTWFWKVGKTQVIWRNKTRRTVAQCGIVLARLKSSQ